MNQIKQKRFKTAVLISLLTSILLGNANVAIAQAMLEVDVDALGPQIGEPVPSFSLPDQNGQIQTLDSIMGPNGAMLLFHRSADW